MADVGGRTLAGKRIAVIGASAGIGRAFATRAGREGAHLVLAARRHDVLSEVIAEAGTGVAVAADISDPADCARVAEVVENTLGEVDLVFVSVGIAPLRLFADNTAEHWRELFDTNVIGVHQIIRACLPLMAPSGIVAALSSDTVGQPRRGLGAYAATKSALAESMSAWRVEHPRNRFSCVVVGGTQPTDFTSGFDPDLLDDVLVDWFARGLVPAHSMPTDDVAAVLAGMFASAADFPGVGLEHLVLKPPSDIRHERSVRT